jgi:hypothetical protein
MQRACFAELKARDVSASSDLTSSLSAGREAFAKLLQVREREREREKREREKRERERERERERHSCK